MSEHLYIWICKWEDFQHYKPERDRPPAWLKDYTKQMFDERYLELTDRQRALLGDLRRSFAVTRGRLSRDVAVIARHRHRQTFRSDLDALNHAGFIEFISRETLERRLEQLYSRARPRAREEGEEEETLSSQLKSVASYAGEPSENGDGEERPQELSGAEMDRILKGVP